jgi:hypothetical protein
MGESTRSDDPRAYPPDVLAGELAALLPAGCYIRVPGGHGDAFAAPESAAAIKAFLTSRTDQPEEH